MRYLDVTKDSWIRKKEFTVFLIKNHEATTKIVICFQQTNEIIQ